MDTDVAVYIVSYELKSQSLGDLELKSFCEGWGALKSVHRLFFSPSQAIRTFLSLCPSGLDHGSSSRKRDADLSSPSPHFTSPIAESTRSEEWPTKFLCSRRSS